MGFEDVVVLIVGALLSAASQLFIIVLGVVIAWRWLHRPGGLAATAPRPRYKNAFEILDERFARGEIDAQDYDERQARLMRQYRQTSQGQ